MDPNKISGTTPDIRCLIVVPALNEENSIAECIDSLLSQSVSDFSIVVADGGSTDRTLEIVSDLALKNPRVEIVANPGRLQSCALNLVAADAGRNVETLIRADAHTLYPPYFVESLLRAARSTLAQSVVVPMYTVGRTCFERAAASAQNSVLGNGGAAHRSLDRTSHVVDHGHHALFDLAFFRHVGGYDESFSHNEDFELDVRIRGAGGLIWLDADNAVAYVPRGSPHRLARQYFMHGRGRAHSIVKHALRPKLRQVLPVFVLAAYIVGIGLGAWLPYLLILPIFHLLATAIWGAFLAARTGDVCCLASGPCAVIMHLAWAVGLCQGLIHYSLSRKRSG
jgi:succinoglycan biosynthesis protein ExoA